MGLEREEGGERGERSLRCVELWIGHGWRDMRDAGSLPERESLAGLPATELSKSQAIT